MAQGRGESWAMIRRWDALPGAEPRVRGKELNKAFAWAVLIGGDK